MEFTEDLKSYCYKNILDLANTYNRAFLSRMDYEAAFFFVMGSLKVPEKRQLEMLDFIMEQSQMQGIPYHKLSPVNQFMMATTPYIWYCLESNPPSNYSQEELNKISESMEFTLSIGDLAKMVSQQVKGALWKPGLGCLGKSAVFLAVAVIVLMGFYLFCGTLY
jgi:hypothetical protein